MRRFGVLLVVAVMCGVEGCLGFRQPYLPEALADSLPPPVHSNQLDNSKAYRPVQDKKSSKFAGSHKQKVSDVAAESSRKSFEKAKIPLEDTSSSDEKRRSSKTVEHSRLERSYRLSVEDVPLQSSKQETEPATTASVEEHLKSPEKLPEEVIRTHEDRSCDGLKKHREFDPHDRWRRAAPGPVALPGPELCASKEPRGQGTAPPDVCDLCPTTVDSKNPLDPCTCVGNSGTGAGKISITCPPTMATTDQIKDIFTNTDFLTTHVFRFTLKGSRVSGVLSQDLWGPLDFIQVQIINNEINHVDNQAFIQSANTLTLLDLDSNNISSYVTMGVDDLPKLQILVLSRNRISIIYSNQFNYSSLRELDLSANQIESIGKNSFAALDKLEVLKLDHNLLENIDDECFKFFNHRPQSNFLQIELSYNKISYISPTGFKGLRNVQINLQHNHLTTIPKEIYLPIIIDSQYFALFYLDGNDIECDCSILWVVEDPLNTMCFDNFQCANCNMTLYMLEPSDLGDCSEETNFST